jgi:hypothetical protein
VHAVPELAALPLTDEERLDSFPVMLKELAEHLNSEMPNGANEKLIYSAQLRGQKRLAPGYPLKSMVECHRVITQVINNVVYENLLTVNLSYLLLDVNKPNDAMLVQIKESIGAYLEAESKDIDCNLT